MVKPRPPRPTVQCVDTYCELYRDLFIEVRAYESFKYLQLGLISDLPKERLKEGDKYRTKPELGAEIVKELQEMGFKIKITTDKETIPKDSTWFVMTKIPNLKYSEVGEV